MNPLPMQCGCPEQYKGRFCPACHGTGVIPPPLHPPLDLCRAECHIQWLAAIKNGLVSARQGARDAIAKAEKAGTLK